MDCTSSTLVPLKVISLILNKMSNCWIQKTWQKEATLARLVTSCKMFEAQLYRQRVTQCCSILTFSINDSS